MPAAPIVHNVDKQRFEANLEGEGLALLEYRRSGQQITFTHTEVPSHSQGHGIATNLAKVALDYARANSLDVVPLCKFVIAYIRHHPEYLRLVSPEHRSKIEKHPK